MMSFHGVRWLGVLIVCALFSVGCWGSDSEPQEAVEDHSAEIAQLQEQAKSGDPAALSRLAFAHQEGRGVPVDHAKAIALHEAAAKQKVVASQAALGRYFTTGVGGTQKQPYRGLHLLREAAQAGNPDAQALLGKTFLTGIGRSLLKSNHKKAEQWLRAASEQGVARADYDLATMYYGREDYEQTLEWLQKAATQDQAQAYTLLSTLYQEGYGVPVDEAESVRLLGRAAELGDPVAQTDFGLALREGSRVESNPTESFEWFEKAAAQGHVEGMFNLGLAYVNGTGVTADPVRGVAWLEICRKEHNHRGAIRALVARRQLTPEQLKAVPELEAELAASVPK